MTDKEYKRIMRHYTWYREVERLFNSRMVDYEFRRSHTRKLWLDNYKSLPNNVLLYLIETIEKDDDFSYTMAGKFRALIDDRINNILLS